MLSKALVEAFEDELTLNSNLPVEFRAAFSPRTDKGAISRDERAGGSDVKRTQSQCERPCAADGFNVGANRSRVDNSIDMNLILSIWLALVQLTSQLRTRPDMASQIGPQPAQVDFEETLASLESLPLFMRALPSEDSGDVALQALQSLAHDGTPDGVLMPCFSCDD